MLRPVPQRILTYFNPLHPIAHAQLCACYYDKFYLKNGMTVSE